MGVDYGSVSPDLYEYSVNSPNPITRYYHTNRYKKIQKFLSENYSTGMTVLDLGCGTSSWNTEKLPLTGLDFNKNMLGYGKKLGFISKDVCWDLGKLPLPFEAQSFDFVILSEVLEHLQQPEKLLSEVGRILKKRGHLIATVPLDSPMSAWNVLFGIKCFLVGNLLGDEYWKNGCGHVQHFSPSEFYSLLEKTGFSISKKALTFMNIGVLAKNIS